MLSEISVIAKSLRENAPVLVWKKDIAGRQ